MDVPAILVLVLMITLSLHQVSSDQMDDDVREAIENGNSRVDGMLALERRLQTSGLTVEQRRSVHHAGRDDVKRQAREVSVKAARILAASASLKEKLNWSADEARAMLPLFSLERTALKDACPDITTCLNGSEKYQPIDGSCHNRVNPGWGKANTPYQRALANAYADGVFEPRKAKDGAELKSARYVSKNFIKLGSNPDARFTLALMSWGQFITHDITKAASFTSADGKAPQCCNATTGGFLNPEYVHPFCLPITIPADDSFYSAYNQTCMTFVRTQIGANFECTTGHAEQLNGITHWLDASMVYGSSETELDSLRTGKDGLLKSTLSEEGKELLPLRPSCSDPTCYYAGDERAQENPQLATLHTLMMREHNRLARDLKTLNPHWDDETVFQEARRIVIAEIQHITYNEYLPALLGPQAMKDYGLESAPMGNFSTYNDNNAGNPAIWNEFAAAAYRVGHSQVQGYLMVYDDKEQQVANQSFLLRDYFFDASLLPQAGFIDNAIRGLTKQPPLIINPEYTADLTNYFNKGSKPYGLDLVALNVQRGREHGIPDYNTVREFCGLPRAATFEDLLNEISPNTLANLKKAYDSVDDIDLYIGCLAEAEKKVNGSQLGPTALCVVAQQFALTKSSDRFFYDVGEQSSSFTIEQLDEIRKTSLARIFCSNSNGDVKQMQPSAFKAPGTENEKMTCDSIPSINLTLWKDESEKSGATSQASGAWNLLFLSAAVTSAYYAL